MRTAAARTPRGHCSSDGHARDLTSQRSAPTQRFLCLSRTAARWADDAPVRVRPKGWRALGWLNRAAVHVTWPD